MRLMCGIDTGLPKIGHMAGNRNWYRRASLALTACYDSEKSGGTAASGAFFQAGTIGC